MAVITLSSIKGGTGKTSVMTLLARFLSRVVTGFWLSKWTSKTRFLSTASRNCRSRQEKHLRSR